MSPRTKQQLEKIRHDRKKAIMDTALEVFAEHGYANASISMIAKKAGISKGLMYNYFQSKEALLTSIINQGMDEIFAMFDSDHDGVLTRDEFVYFVEEMFRLITSKRNFYKLYFALMMQHSVSRSFSEKFQEMAQPFMEIMKAYYEKKGVEHPELEAVLVGAIFDGIGFHYMFNPDFFPLDKVKDLIIERFV